jgi:hypothetical protein
VNLALADGSRLDDVMLISVGHGSAPTLWVFASGIDGFLPRLAVVDACEAPPARARSGCMTSIVASHARGQSGRARAQSLCQAFEETPT